MLIWIAKRPPNILGMILLQKRRGRAYVYALAALNAHAIIHVREMRGRNNCPESTPLLA